MTVDTEIHNSRIWSQSVSIPPLSSETLNNFPSTADQHKSDTDLPSSIIRKKSTAEKKYESHYKPYNK